MNNLTPGLIETYKEAWRAYRRELNPQKALTLAMRIGTARMMLYEAGARESDIARWREEVKAELKPDAPETAGR